MSAFVQKHGDAVTGILSGFDRLIFHGQLQRLMDIGFMLAFLRFSKVRLEDFGAYAKATSAQVIKASLSKAKALNRPTPYVYSAAIRKDEQAKVIAAHDNIKTGLVCVLRIVEPCHTFDVFREHGGQLRRAFRKCLHLYHYFMHPTMGLMHVRLQTWFPFRMQVYVNGREWLSRTLDGAGIEYLKHDNCFLRIADMARAQQLFSAQLQMDWLPFFNAMVSECNPAFSDVFKNFNIEYYWTLHQSEWATDVMFKDTQALDAVYPRLIRHAITTFDSPSVMRFLGRHVPATGQVMGNFKGEVVTWYKRLPECIRIRHALNENSLKLYNKGSVLRVETTINNTKEFKVFRPKEGDRKGRKSWRPLRRGIADIGRRAEVCQSSNLRYLDALAKVEHDETFGQLLEQPCRHTIWNGKRVRALQPCGQDAELLAAIGDGAFAINGFRNRDLGQKLFSTAAHTKQEARRRSAHITRKLHILRAHGLINKVHKTHRYQLTAKGRSIVAATTAASKANANKLIDLAA